MSTLIELAEQINLLFPIKDKALGKRYRIVDQLGGTTELEEASGKARYISTRALQNSAFWQINPAFY